MCSIRVMRPFYVLLDRPPRPIYLLVLHHPSLFRSAKEANFPLFTGAKQLLQYQGTNSQ